jgi:hypothetical protein
MQLMLTKSSDILPAVSGCARVISEQNKDQFLAGLWKRTFSKDLLWYNNGRNGIRRPSSINPELWTAPTWSWASLPSGQDIGFMKFGSSSTYDYLLTLNDNIRVVRCEPKGENDMGELSHGLCFLNANVRLFPCSLRFFKQYLRKDTRRCMLDFNDRIEQMHVNGLCESPYNDVEALNSDFGHLDFRADGFPKLELDFRIRCPDCSVSRVWLLHAAVSVVKNHRLDIFLVLTKVKPGDLAFERVGLTLYRGHTTKVREEWFKTVWENQCTPLCEITLL